MEAARTLEAGGTTPLKVHAKLLPRSGPGSRSTVNEKYPRERYPREKYPYDEEGPDYWKAHIMDLKEKGSINEEIKHVMNMDWELTHELLEDYFVRLAIQPAFVPRRGETVLWLHEYDGKLEWNPEGKCYQIFTPDGNWGEKPEWRAGVITQAPEEPNVYLDINTVTQKEKPVNYSGFRVETLPDPLSTNKSLSMQSKYVPLKCIRPFSAFARFIQSTPREQLHPSIEYAMTTMASWNLLSHTRIHGSWPNARLESRGIFIGPELITLQDAVRLKPVQTSFENTHVGSNVTRGEIDPVDVMVVERIWLQMNGCDADPESHHLARKNRPFLAGRVYTRDANRLARPLPFKESPLQKLTHKEVTDTFRQIGMHLYGDWYRVAGGELCAVSPSMVLGRCFEPEATIMYYGDDRLDYDLHSVLNGRNYSNRADSRIPEGVNWFWGASRNETLGLSSMNGVECGLGAPQRENPERWQAILKILSGPYTDADIRQAGLPRRAGRPSLKEKFGEVGRMSALVQVGLGGSSGPSDNNSDEKNEMASETNSEFDLTETELRASIPYRGVTEADEMDDYKPEDEDVAM